MKKRKKKKGRNHVWVNRARHEKIDNIKPTPKPATTNTATYTATHHHMKNHIRSGTNAHQHIPTVHHSPSHTTKYNHTTLDTTNQYTPLNTNSSPPHTNSSSLNNITHHQTPPHTTSPCHCDHSGHRRCKAHHRNNLTPPHTTSDHSGHSRCKAAIIGADKQNINKG